jgi:hypothetical protein
MSLNPFRLVSCPLGTTSSFVVKGVEWENKVKERIKKAGSENEFHPVP